MAEKPDDKHHPNTDGNGNLQCPPDFFLHFFHLTAAKQIADHNLHGLRDGNSIDISKIRQKAAIALCGRYGGTIRINNAQYTNLRQIVREILRP